MTPKSSERDSRFSCTPSAFAAVLVFTGLAWTWRVAAPGTQNVHDPQAAPHAIAQRTDLRPDEKATIALFQEASRSVVHITNLQQFLSRDRFRLNTTELPQGTGTGFVWDERGFVVTNFHVVASADRIMVTLGDGSDWEAEVVGAEPDFDLAVVKIEAPREKLRALPIGTSQDLLVGQSVFAIGNPFGLDQTLTTGVISGLDREILSVTRRTIRNVIQTDAAINPGNSGGPLLDSAGRLIGVNTAITSPSGASAGIGFAVPVDTVNRVVPELLRSGRFARPVLGIRMAPDLATKELGVEGVLVHEVVPNSGAARAGLRSVEVDRDGTVRGDVIIAIDGQTIRKDDDLLGVLAERRAGDTVRVVYLREGKRREAEIELQTLE